MHVSSSDRVLGALILEMPCNYKIDVFVLYRLISSLRTYVQVFNNLAYVDSQAYLVCMIECMGRMQVQILYIDMILYIVITGLHMAKIN